MILGTISCASVWRDEILEVPAVSIPEDGMGQKGEGEEGVQQGEKNGQSVVEDDD
jgi:hypothetical protein